MKSGKAFVDPSAMTLQMGENPDFWSLPPLTILCLRTLLVFTKHPEDGPGIVQMNNTTIMFLTFSWGSAFDQEWAFPEHNVFQEQALEVTMLLADDNFPPSSEKNQQAKHSRLYFDLEKLKDPNVLETFQAMIDWKFAPLTVMNNEDADMDSMTTTFNIAVTETATEIFGRRRQKKIPWITAEILDLCDKRRELRKNRFEP